MSKKKKKSIEIIRKHDKSIEVSIRQNPATSSFGKITGAIIIIGFVVLPIIALIFAIVNMMNAQ